MKRMTLRAVWALLFLVSTTLFFSCKKESSDLSSAETYSTPAGKGNSNSTSNFSDYNIAVSVSADGKTWTYTITKAKANAKNLSHLIIDLNNCGAESASFANIVSATVNGAAADLSPTEGSGTGCSPQTTTNNFIKINFSAASSWVLVITFDRGYYIFDTAAGWVKAGTSCNTGTLKAPGCPREDYCSFSQGFFFANGSFTNGAAASWVNGLTVGGIIYTHAQGANFWNIDRGRGGDQTMNAFFQLGAVRLSGVETEVLAHVAIIDAYFTGLNINDIITHGTAPNGSSYQYFNLPATGGGYTKAQVQAAGSAIGTYVDDNHCE
jgi:hypothetical protein